MAEKPLADRVKESVHLLKQLLAGGVQETAAGYAELKERISEWVKTGKRWEGDVEFPIYGRYAEVVLPFKSSQTATIAFRVKKGRT